MFSRRECRFLSRMVEGNISKVEGRGSKEVKKFKKLISYPIHIKLLNIECRFLSRVEGLGKKIVLS